MRRRNRLRPVLIPLAFLVLAAGFPVHAQPVKEVPTFVKHFRKAGVHGSLLLFDEARGQYLAYNAARIDSVFLPASTFKIFNSLAALESGVAPDERLVIPWDSVVRRVNVWNKDQDMVAAFRNSTVPYYQELARRMGRERLLGYLQRAHYGNETIGPEVDMFWLDGSLKISQRQQIDFLRKLRHDQLQFSPRNQQIVRTLMCSDSTADYAVRSKTGWGILGEQDYGWWVGWVERKEGTCYFALNIHSDNPPDNFAALRLEITVAALRELGWLPE